MRWLRPALWALLACLSAAPAAGDSGRGDPPPRWDLGLEAEFGPADGSLVGELATGFDWSPPWWDGSMSLVATTRTAVEGATTASKLMQARGEAIRVDAPQWQSAASLDGRIALGADFALVTGVTGMMMGDQEAAAIATHLALGLAWRPTERITLGATGVAAWRRVSPRTDAGGAAWPSARGDLGFGTALRFALMPDLSFDAAYAAPLGGDVARGGWLRAEATFARGPFRLVVGWEGSPRGRAGARSDAAPWIIPCVACSGAEAELVPATEASALRAAVQFTF